ncbi:hypothetical protein RNJ44_04436 [Nakaseomyces bracarensis]|uniref:Uncharacterized protein n=1 Tax=Nakaseomyces bracarensis TaxID=273131 RepID=A0ABR4NUY4_9SACH
MSVLALSLNFNILRYSYYNDKLPAPQGFSSTFAKMKYNLWTHITTEGLSFQMEQDSTGKLRFQVVGREQIVEKKVYEKIHTSMLRIQSDVQFSAKLPVISCKYLVTSGEEQLMRRFQLELREKDFNQLYDVLLFLGTKVKDARVVNTDGVIEKVVGAHFEPSNSKLLDLINLSKNDDIATKHKNYQADILETQLTDNAEHTNLDVLCTQSYKNDELDFVHHSKDIEKMGYNSKSGEDVHHLNIENVSKISSTTLKEPNQRTEIRTRDNIQSSHHIALQDENIKDKKENIELELNNQPCTTVVGMKCPVLALDQNNNLNNMRIKSNELISLEFKPILSKSIIKKKLKDRKFMKWVREVESYFLSIDTKNSMKRRARQKFR